MHILRINLIFNNILIFNPLFVNFYSIENFVFVAKNPCSLSLERFVLVQTISSVTETSEISNVNSAEPTFTVTVVPLTEYVPETPSFEANEGLY